MEDWAEIRRLHRAEGVPIAEIARRLGIARNSARAALVSDRPPRYERPAKGSLSDAVEPWLRALLAEWPRMPATVVAQRIGWQHSLTTLKDRLRLLRPEYLGIDPVDRTVYAPGEIAQCDLWFPAVKIPVGAGQDRILPVLVMALGFSWSVSAVMIPSRQAGDILSGMWQVISGWGRCPKTLVWDREAAIGGTGRVSASAAAFAGTLATRILLAPPRDPEFKGLVERVNGFLETSFLPGRTFTSPNDFNSQLAGWLPLANQRTVRSIGARPVDVFETDYQAMVPLPPTVPPIGLNSRIRLARDYYVRVDTVDYSVDPRLIGRFVDVTASLSEVVVLCDGKVVARHRRSWAKQGVVTDVVHRERARLLRLQHAELRRQPARHHTDGPRGGSARPTGLRRPVRRRLQPQPQPRAGSRQPMTSTATKTAPTGSAAPARREPADGVPSQLAYLTRVLKMPTVGRTWQQLADQARDENWSHEEFLAAALARQVADRESACSLMRIRTAHFPAVKTLEDFNLDHLPSLRRDVLAHLATGTFIAKAENVILLGPPGIGKTHLAIGLGVKAAQTGYSVLFDTANNWIARLAAAHQAGHLDVELERIRRYRLIIIDEVGYIPFDRDAANLFFQLIASRYEQGSVMVTSNLPFGRWGETFSDDVVAAAMIDRLVHHAEVLTLTGDSYRTRARRDLLAKDNRAAQ